MKCEENFCEDHYFFCKVCSTDKDDEKYKKLCLKNCTFKCINCDNKVNVLCNKNNHPNNYVENTICNHYVCNSCVKKCLKCGKVVVTCPKCINNFFYVRCNYCDNYLCSECCGKCNQCEDDYCNLGHTCISCQKKNYDCTKWCLDKKKIWSVEKMFVTLRSPKMGKLCPVYPSKVRFFRLLDVLCAYPSAPQNRLQSEEI